MFQDVISLLGRMGLKEKDAHVYLTCLHFPQGLYVHEIVRETGMNRSTVDVVLERLVAAGFANRLRTGSRDRYLAQSPEAQ